MWTEAWALWHRIVLLLTLRICTVGGEEYLIAFTKPPEDVTLALSLTLTNLETYNVDVETSVPQNTAAIVPSPTQTTVLFGTTDHVALDSSLVMRSAGVFKSVVHVVSQGEIAVQAFASYWQPPVKVQMSCLALPVSLMTQNYAVLTHCDKGYCVMAVLARHNNTVVTVTLELPADAQVAYKGLNYTNGQQVHETLQAFEAMQLLCLMCDLSGTLVTASKPVAVVAGADSYQVTRTVTPTSSGSGGLLGLIAGLLGGGSSGGTPTVETQVTDLEYTMAQVPPLEMLRDAYILATTPLVSLPVLVKVKAFNIGTNITFFGYKFTAKADEQMWTFNISGPLMDALIADGPVLVGQFHPGHNDTFRVSGDETMFFPVPVSQWRKEYRLFVPTLTHPDAEYVILVMFYPNQTNAEDCISFNTTIYSALVNAMRNASHRYVMYGPGYDNITGVRLQVQRQTYLYVYVSWSCPGNIGGFLYSYGNGTSWSVPLGLPLDDFIPVSEPTSTTTSEVTSDTEAVTDVTSTEPLTTTPSTEAPSTSPSTPAKLLPTLPSDLSLTVPSDLPVSVPTDLQVTVPTDLPVTVPTDLPVTVPTDLAISVPAIPTLPSLPSLPPIPSFCPCLCRPRYQLEILANHTLLVPPEQYESELVVPKETLSSTRRKKTSAEDKRTSSSALGVYMTAIPVGLVMVLFYLDFCHKGIARIRAAYLKKKREKS
ncbi:uncharacterized protein [Littorina saxatilis]|uniref:IgGFc-binding protein N-terminal domain-containing protein n=1 Tax=Littorina saxatilis TaxID=31220 RepID=A0AAN9G7B6_9CAEN